MYINESAEFIINRLCEKGYTAYAVGGAVRDSLMGSVPDDTDITTDALPSQVKEIFSDYRIIESGIKHGTVAIIVNNTFFEITTFRTEKEYTDGRHPDKVIFSTSIYDDLSRRDFTMNSIAFNPSQGYIDPYNGLDDIKKEVIRCVGNAKERFTEDSLRILRGLRFASTLGFEIEKETAKAMRECKELLKNISAERIFTELSKMLCGKNIKNILISYCDIVSVIIPEIKRMENFNQHNFHHKYTLLEHTAVVTQSIPPVTYLRFAALLHDIAKPLCLSFDEAGIGHFYKHSSKGAALADDILKRLRCDNNTREKIVKLIKLHDTPIEEREQIIKKKLRTVGEDMLYDLIKLQRADTEGLAEEFRCRAEHFEKLENMIKEIISQQQCFSLKDLAINGKDVSALGLCGKQIGNALNFALEAVIEEKAENKKEVLLELIKNEL